MLLDVIASRRSRRVVLTHRVMPSLASRHVASRRLPSCVSLSVVPSSLHRRRLASPVSSLPSLALHRCRVVIAHRPTVFGWLLCLSPLLLTVVCVASHCLPSRVASSPPRLTCSVVASHRARPSHRCRLSRTCPLTVSPLPSLALHPFVSPHTSLRRSCRRRRVASSPPCLTCPSLSS
jgi:hypothetical protein